MSQSHHLSMTLLKTSQERKEAAINDALCRIDALLNTGAHSRALATPPTSPAQGDLYIVASGATDAWAGQDNAVAYFDQLWRFVTPNEGLTLWVNDENALYSFDGGAWVASGGSGPLSGMLGVNATPDAVNRLAVKSEAVLFDHDGADMRMKLNKASAAHTASQLFQAGYVGHAEFGLTGDNNFHVKVSPDGASWKDALVVDRTSGALTPGQPSATRVAFNILRGLVQPQTQLLIEAMSTAPTRKRTFLIDDTILALQAAGIWNKLDLLYVMAAPDAGVARLNWKAPGSYTLQPVAAPGFAADTGFTGNGSSAYLDTGFNLLSAPGKQYTQNSAHIGILTNTISPNAGYDLGVAGLINLRIVLRGASDSYNVNTASVAGAVLASDLPGHIVAVRDSSSTSVLYYNGTLAHNSTSTSSAIPDRTLLVGHGNGTYSDRQWSAVHAGAALSAGEVATLYATLQAYRNAL